MRRLPSLRCADVHRGCRYRWRVEAPVIAGCSFHHSHLLQVLLPPLLPGCWMDWAVGSDRSGLVKYIGAAVQIYMALSTHWNQSRLSQSVVQAMQWMTLISFLGYHCLTSLWNWKQSACLVWLDLGHWMIVPHKILQSQLNYLTNWRPVLKFQVLELDKSSLSKQLNGSNWNQKVINIAGNDKSPSIRRDFFDVLPAALLIIDEVRK